MKFIEIQTSTKKPNIMLENHLSTSHLRLSWLYSIVFYAPAAIDREHIVFALSVCQGHNFQKWPLEEDLSFTKTSYKC